MQYLIGYDITEPKRLVRIYRKMTKFATPIQYSLFLFEGSRQQLQGYLKDVLKIFNAKEDDLRVYPLPAGIHKWQAGKEILPEGIVWSALL